MTFTSRYTPSVLPGEVLEQLFVAREQLLADIVDRVRRAVSTGDRTHTLLVGPRGAGKTHLVSLVAHRVQRMIDDGLEAQIAWLAEDPWTIDSHTSLMRQVAQALGRPAADFIGSDLPAGPLVVVIVENLDEILDAIGEVGQQRLRRSLSDGRLLFAATTTNLSRDLADQARPFYGFFTTTRLEPFDVDDAARMIERIAVADHDEALAAYLDTAPAKARLRVVEHLAGGAPRMWSLLASALTVGQLDDLVQLLVHRFDDLTPYYQERLGRLAPQQRRIVARLAELDRAVSVKDLAADLELAERSVGKAMSDLRERGWVQPVESPFMHLLDARRTYYELAEPMVRLAFQIKASRGRPIALLIEFLKGWYDRTTLEAAVARGSYSGAYAIEALKSYDNDASHSVALRLSGLPASRVGIVATLDEIDRALVAIRHADAEPLIGLPSVVRQVVEGILGPNPDDEAIRITQSKVHREALSEIGSVRNPLMDAWIERAADPSVGLPLELIAWLAAAWRFDEAGLILDHLGPVYEPVDMLYPRTMLARSLADSGRVVEAVAQLRLLRGDHCQFLGEDHPETLKTRNSLALCLGESGRLDEAIAEFRLVHDDQTRVLGADHPDAMATRNNLAVWLGMSGRLEEAIAELRAMMHDRLRLLGADHPDLLITRSNLASMLAESGRVDEAIAEFRVLLDDQLRVLGADHPDTLTTRHNLASMLGELGREGEAIAELQVLLNDRLRVLGVDHPDTLGTRNNLAVSFAESGRLGEAIAEFRVLLDDLCRVLGADHPNTLRTRNNSAWWLGESGRVDEAIAEFRELLVDRLRVLGASHSDVAVTRAALDHWNRVAES
jgi:tetratricopeptide (TPR) repeat protein